MFANDIEIELKNAKKSFLEEQAEFTDLLFANGYIAEYKFKKVRNDFYNELKNDFYKKTRRKAYRYIVYIDIFDSNFSNDKTSRTRVKKFVGCLAKVNVKNGFQRIEIINDRLLDKFICNTTKQINKYKKDILLCEKFSDKIFLLISKLKNCVFNKREKSIIEAILLAVFVIFMLCVALLRAYNKSQFYRRMGWYL